jgi:hypothetical protein
MIDAAYQIHSTRSLTCYPARKSGAAKAGSLASSSSKVGRMKRILLRSLPTLLALLIHGGSARGDLRDGTARPDCASVLSSVEETPWRAAGDVLRDIPHDVPAMVVYLLVGGFMYAIWRGSRSRPKS